MAWQDPWFPPPRSRRRTLPASSHPREAVPASRSQRGRQRRQKATERGFALIFVLTVGATTAYLFLRSPWGQALHWIR